jgi:hypothetical protein
MQVYSFYGNVPRGIHEDNGDSHRKCICRTDDKIDVQEVTLLTRTSRGAAARLSLPLYHPTHPQIHHVCLGSPMHL